MERVTKVVRSQNMKIAVISNGTESHKEDRGLSEGIATELNRVLSGSKALAYVYVIREADEWFKCLQRAAVTHYIFIGLPPCIRGGPEVKYFSPSSQRTMEVVVVGMASVSTPEHCLQHFLHLEGNALDIAGMALYHFAG